MAKLSDFQGDYDWAVKKTGIDENIARPIAEQVIRNADKLASSPLGRDFRSLFKIAFMNRKS